MFIGWLSVLAIWIVAAFGTIILLSMYWRKLTNIGALAGMVSGTGVAFIWGKIDALAKTLYEIVPGFLACLVVTVIVSLLTYQVC